MDSGVRACGRQIREGRLRDPATVVSLIVELDG
jgi:hypothetical protein